MSVKRTLSKLFAVTFLLGLSGPLVCVRSEPQKDTARDHIESGKRAYANKDYKLAIKEFKKAQSLDKTLAEPYLRLAVCYFNGGKSSDILKNLQEAIKRQPDYPDAHAWLARFYYFTNDIPMAQKELATALEQGGTGAGIHELQGDLKELDNDFKTALTEYQTAVQLADPGDPGTVSLREKMEAVDKYVSFTREHRGEPVTMPAALNRPTPNYTEDARRNKIQGVIRERALIDQTGRVVATILITRLGHGLDEQAQKATRAMNFRPATIGGKPVPFWVTLEVEFQLR
jgi:TonB family protein